MKLPSSLPWIAALTLAAMPHIASAQSPMPANGAEFIEQMDAHFEANPELKRSGAGWKPFNRFKWAYEHRMRPGFDAPATARWDAYLEKLDIERSMGDPGPTWFSLGPSNFGGRMLAIDVDPSNTDIVYAGAAGGGLFKSLDGGVSWFATTDALPSLGVGGVAVSRVNPSTVVIGTGEPTFNVGRTTGIGIYRSADGGVTWTQVMGTDGTSFINGWYDVQVDPGDSERVYAVKGNDISGNGVYVSVDDGVTWALSGLGQPSSPTFGKSKLAVSGDTVYCVIGEQGFGGSVWGLIKSVNDGLAWSTPAANNLPDSQSWYNLSAVADPNDSERVFCAAVRLGRSTDGGNNFFEVGTNVHVDHHALLYEPGSDRDLWALSDGGLWSSANDGTSWINRNNGVVTYQFYDICVNNGAAPYYVMGGTQDNGTDKWSGTTTWANGLGADGMVCNVDPTDPTNVYAEIQFGDHRKSTNSGGSFFSINSGITGSGQWITPVDQDQTNGDRLFTESSSGIFRTVNGGSSWQNVSSIRADWISISPVDPDVVWVVRNFAVHKSSDGGDTFDLQSSYGFAAAPAYKIIAHPVDVNTAFVVMDTYNSVSRVARTTDGGASWEDVSGDLPNMPIYGISINPSNPIEWFLGTNLGVWASFNNGASWLPYGAGMPNATVYDVEIQNELQKLVAGTHGRGAWEADIGFAVSTEEVSTPLPRNLMLDSPWPNPVSDRTLIRYAARVDVPVTLRIFDVQGRMVEELETFTTGDGIVRTTPWHTKGAANGVYMAVLEAGTERIAQKVLVQR